VTGAVYAGVCPAECLAGVPTVERAVGVLNFACLAGVGEGVRERERECEGE
jgi:hypothetical protein